MGEVRAAIEQRNPETDEPGLRDQLEGLATQISLLCAQKDEDVESEGSELAADNRGKAAKLRACYTLVIAAVRLLEDY